MAISCRNLFAVLTLGVVVACAPAAPPVPTPTLPASAAIATPAPANPPTVAPTQTPRPVKVQAKADEKLAASAVISATGGTLTAKGTDGTQFTLTVPNDALLEETRITLTPVTTMEGLPFSGTLVGAVQMSPEGLRFFQPVTLTIESPNAVAARGFETVGFGYHESGEGLYLNPSQAKGNTLTLAVLHFSGAGAAQGTGAEIQAQYQRVPANAEDALNQRMAEYLGRERQRQLLGQPADPELQTKIIAYQREYFAKVIQPLLAVIRQDCEASKRLLPQALGWLRMVQLWGWDDQFRSESQQIFEAWDDGIVNCYNKEYDECVKDNDIKHRAAMLNLLRLAEMGRSSAGGGGLVARLDQSKITKCPRRSYRVDFGTADMHWFGTICSLDKPFKVQYLIPSAGCDTVFTFTPSSNAAGTVRWMGICTGAGGVATPDNDGTYTVVGTDAAPVVHTEFQGGTDTSRNPAIPVTMANTVTAIPLPLQPLDPPCDQ